MSSDFSFSALVLDTKLLESSNLARACNNTIISISRDGIKSAISMNSLVEEHFKALEKYLLSLSKVDSEYMALIQHQKRYHSAIVIQLFTTIDKAIGDHIREMSENTSPASSTNERYYISLKSLLQVTLDAWKTAQGRFKLVQECFPFRDRKTYQHVQQVYGTINKKFEESMMLWQQSRIEDYRNFEKELENSF